MTNDILSKKNSLHDKFLWFLILLIFLSTIFSHYYFTELSFFIKLLAWLLILIIEIGLIWLTQKGKNAFQFCKDAVGELYKITWPTRIETYHSTIIVIIIVTVITLLIWGIDSIFLGIIKVLTGH